MAPGRRPPAPGGVLDCSSTHARGRRSSIPENSLLPTEHTGIYIEGHCAAPRTLCCTAKDTVLHEGHCAALMATGTIRGAD